MNNLKKIGLSALAGSLVATSAFAGEMSVAGGASLNVEHKNGNSADTGKSFSMGNQLTFTGGGELENGLNVSLSFIIDQNDDKSASYAAKSTNAGTPFDSHSLTISSDGLGSLKFSGEGGSSAISAMDGTAAGDVWDKFDTSTAITPTGIGGGDNSMMYTLPAMVDGVAINASYTPRGTADSTVAWNATYTGVEGLSVYAAAGENNNAAAGIDNTMFGAKYAMGAFTIGYQVNETDSSTASADEEFTALGVSYAVSDDLSVSLNSSTIDFESGTNDQEATGISFSYTTGGLTISGSHSTVDNVGGTGSADNTGYELNFGFAF